MGRIFVINLEGRIYRCKHCHTHLALSDDIMSKVFFSPLSSPLQLDLSPVLFYVVVFYNLSLVDNFMLILSSFQLRFFIYLFLIFSCLFVLHFVGFLLLNDKRLCLLYMRNEQNPNLLYDPSTAFFDVNCPVHAYSDGCTKICPI